MIGKASKLQYLVAGLRALHSAVRGGRITGALISDFGVGSGGLNFADLQALIEWEIEADKDIKAMIYPPRQPDKVSEVPLMTIISFSCANCAAMMSIPRLTLFSTFF